MSTKTDVTIHIGRAGLTTNAVIQLYTAVGWGDGTSYDHEQIESALERTSFVVYATDQDKNLLGFARAFSDDIFYTSLAEIIVSPQYQRRGIGRALLEAVIERYAGTAIYLEALAGREDFFLRCGFDKKGQMTVLARRPLRS